MSNPKMFKSYFNHLAEYQNRLLPDKLNKDYIIIYDYIMDLLQKDAVVGELLVRQKQQMSNINADILLDFTRLFDTRAYIYEPYLCLTLTGRENKRFTNFIHPFCNENQSIVPRNVKKSIWLALHKGFLMIGSYVLGYYGDIYEIKLCSSDHIEGYIRVNAYSDDIDLNINLRVLINYAKSPYSESATLQPYPPNELNREWFAMLPRRLNTPFEVCLPKLEYEIKQKCFRLVMILRLCRFFLKKHKQLYLLDAAFPESIIYSEYMENKRFPKGTSHRYDYIFCAVLTRIYKALKNKYCCCFWNQRLNLFKSVDKSGLISNGFHKLHNLINTFKTMRNDDPLKYEDFFEFFGKYAKNGMLIWKNIILLKLKLSYLKQILKWNYFRMKWMNSVFLNRIKNYLILDVKHNSLNIYCRIKKN